MNDGLPAAPVGPTRYFVAYSVHGANDVANAILDEHPFLWSCRQLPRRVMLHWWKAMDSADLAAAAATRQLFGA
jgi:hypothetical protein